MTTKIKIEIPEAHLKHLHEFYLKRVEELRAEIEKLSQELISITEMLDQINNSDSESKSELSNNNGITILPNGYIKQWSWRKKIKFVLKANARPLSAKEISNYILAELEPELANEKNRVYATISGQLSNAIRDDKDFIRSKNEIDEFVYAIKQ